MMCGTSSHGEIETALKHGGCGHMFFWDSLKPCNVYYYYKGERKTGFTGDLRPGMGGRQADTWEEAAANHKGGPNALHPHWPKQIKC